MEHIDLLMSSNSVSSDVVLPAATWDEKDDRTTSDMHPFIHPLSAAVDPAWESRSDWKIFRAIAKKFSDVAPEVLGVEHDVVLSPILHDTAGELAQPYEPRSDEHTSELQSLMRISHAVFCLKKKQQNTTQIFT